MKKAAKIIGIVAALLFGIGLIVLSIAESRYQFLLASPRVSHEALLTQATSVRVVVQPPLAHPFIMNVMGEKAPPEWIVRRAVPYEAALLASPDLNARRFDVALFMNTQRFTPLIVEASKSYGVAAKFPYFTWDADSFTVRQSGVIAMNGTMPIDNATAEDVLAQWGAVSVPGRPPIEGNHAAEVSIDNRDGSLYALIALFANNGIIELPVDLAEVRSTLYPVATLAVTADLLNPDDLAIRFVIECSPTAEEGQVTAVNFTLGAILSELTQQAQVYRAGLSGSKKVEGTTITGDYTLTNFRALLRI